MTAKALPPDYFDPGGTPSDDFTTDGPPVTSKALRRSRMSSQRSDNREQPVNLRAARFDWKGYQMRGTAVGGIVLLAVVLAGAGCSQSADLACGGFGDTGAGYVRGSFADSSASPSEVASQGPATGVKITFEKVKSKR